jgi:hypothetical protein
MFSVQAFGKDRVMSDDCIRDTVQWLVAKKCITKIVLDPKTLGEMNRQASDKQSEPINGSLRNCMLAARAELEDEFDDDETIEVNFEHDPAAPLSLEEKEEKKEEERKKRRVSPRRHSPGKDNRKDDKDRDDKDNTGAGGGGGTDESGGNNNEAKHPPNEKGGDETSKDADMDQGQANTEGDQVENSEFDLELTTISYDRDDIANSSDLDEESDSETPLMGDTFISFCNKHIELTDGNFEINSTEFLSL